MNLPDPNNEIKPPPQVSDRDRRSDRHLMISLAGFLVAIWLLHLVILLLGTRRDEIYLSIDIGITYGGLSLLSFWLALSNLRLSLRRAFALAGVLVSFLASMFAWGLFDRNIIEASLVLVFGSTMVLHLMVLSLVFVQLKRRYGFQLKRPTLQSIGPSERASQFAIRDLFFTTIFVAVFLMLLPYLLRLSATNGSRVNVPDIIRLCIVFGLIICFHLVIVGPLFLTLLRENIRIWSVVAIVIVSVALTIIQLPVFNSILGRGGSGYGFFVALNLPSFLVVAISLLLVRGFGYRLSPKQTTGPD